MGSLFKRGIEESCHPYARAMCVAHACFFFQAEDGIRDVAVTGVQTCALPISLGRTGCGALLVSPRGRFILGGAFRLYVLRDKSAVRAGTAFHKGLRLAHKRVRQRDRKSTRLNSSHGYISYAVFCLKKKNNTSDLAWCYWDRHHHSFVFTPYHIFVFLAFIQTCPSVAFRDRVLISVKNFDVSYLSVL